MGKTAWSVCKTIDRRLFFHKLIRLGVYSLIYIVENPFYTKSIADEMFLGLQAMAKGTFSLYSPIFLFYAHHSVELSRVLGTQMFKMTAFFGNALALFWACKS